ncbi:PAS domain-containing protein [Bradyrhizobium guangdongense]
MGVGAGGCYRTTPTRAHARTHGALPERDRRIIAKDARNLRYLFINKAAEKQIGMSRAEIVGKTARELFSKETADLIEQRDKQLLAQQQQLEPITDTINNPIRGRRQVSWRRLQIGGAEEDSHIFVTMVEDHGKEMGAAA